MKKYNGGQYAFVALLPKDGISVSEYIAALDGADLYAMLSNPQHTTVYTTLPKFETEYDVEMSGILKGMGMPNAFNSNADFSGISPSGIYISRVLHKTFISVSERGTKAGAATAVEMNCTGYPQDPKEVYLDRPFVYMLVDLENNIPFFIGTLMAC
jgi:serpin B